MDPRHLRTTMAHPDELKSAVFDMFHANTVSIIDRNIDDVFAKGNILFCVRNLDLIGVLDPATEDLLWTWGPGQLDMPHHPTLLDNGHILIFDNGARRGFSRVVEFDPSSEEIVWEYESDPRTDFFSVSRGAAQRLPNGNTLITESDKGHAFEVTADGEMVWEFSNPEHRDGERLVIYRLLRITNPELYPCLERLPK